MIDIDLSTRLGCNDFLKTVRENSSDLSDREVVALWMDVFHHHLKKTPNPMCRTIVVQLNKLLYQRFSKHRRESILAIGEPDESDVCAWMMLMAIDFANGIVGKEYFGAVGVKELKAAKFKLAATITEKQFREVWDQTNGNVTQTASILGYKTRASVHKWLDVLEIER